MNGLEAEFAASLIVMRVSVQTPVGEEIAAIYGSRVTPTFIFLDESGNEVWRQIGRLDAEKIRTALAP